MERTMAGQPQDPSWQPGPGAQDQAREAWPPPPSFTPQSATPQAAPTTAQPQDTFIYPPPPAYGQPGQSAQQAQPGQGYPPPTYNPQDQAQAYASQDLGQAYSPQDQAQGMPQWQANQGQGGPRAASSRPRGEKGFVGSLFDFSFQSMVTPKIIKVLYILLTLFVGLWALVFTLFCFKHAGAVGGFFVLIVLDPIYILLTLGVYRVVLEFVMVTFRIHEDVQAIRAKGEGQG
jgi:hypothetical protein